MPKPLSFSQHAEDAVTERDLDPAWIERTVRAPGWTIPDPKRPGIERPGIERRFRAIPEYGDRVLRVACYETPAEIRIVTVFFDRDARKAR